MSCGDLADEIHRKEVLEKRKARLLQAAATIISNPNYAHNDDAVNIAFSLEKQIDAILGE